MPVGRVLTLSITADILQRWLAHEGWYAIKQINQIKKLSSGVDFKKNKRITFFRKSLGYGCYLLNFV